MHEFQMGYVVRECVFLNINEASPESACVRSGVLLFGVSWPFVKSTAKNTLNDIID